MSVVEIRPCNPEARANPSAADWGWVTDWEVVHVRTGKVIVTMTAPQPQNLLQAIEDDDWMSPVGAAQHLAAVLNSSGLRAFGKLCDEATSKRIAGVV